MSSIITTLRRQIYKIKTTYLRLGNLLLVVALALCAIWAVSAIATMTKNWEGQRQLETARLASARLALEIDMAELAQEYYRSSEYRELVARTSLGKALEGETLVLLPKNSTRAIEKYTPKDSPPPSPESNLTEWLRFLFP